MTQIIILLSDIYDSSADIVHLFISAIPSCYILFFVIDYGEVWLVTVLLHIHVQCTLTYWRVCV